MWCLIEKPNNNDKQAARDCVFFKHAKNKSQTKHVIFSQNLFGEKQEGNIFYPQNSTEKERWKRCFPHCFKKKIQRKETYWVWQDMSLSASNLDILTCTKRSKWAFSSKLIVLIPSRARGLHLPDRAYLWKRQGPATIRYNICRRATPWWIVPIAALGFVLWGLLPSRPPI